MVFLATTAGIVIMGVSGSVIGGSIMYYFKKPFSMGAKTIEFFYYRRKARKLIKKGILKENRQTLKNGFNILISKDYSDYRIKLKKLYNLTDTIIDNDKDFNEFYKLKVETTADIVARYCRDNSITMIENSEFREEQTPPPPDNDIIEISLTD